MAKADHRAAAEVYRRAAALDPDDMSIRFALGTAQSFLDQKREAVEAFRGVVTRGDPASVEYREAKRWLAAVGVPATPEPVPSAGSAPAKAGGRGRGHAGEAGRRTPRRADGMAGRSTRRCARSAGRCGFTARKR